MLLMMNHTLCFLSLVSAFAKFIDTGGKNLPTSAVNLGKPSTGGISKDGLLRPLLLQKARLAEIHSTGLCPSLSLSKFTYSLWSCRAKITSRMLSKHQSVWDYSLSPG